MTVSVGYGSSASTGLAGWFLGFLGEDCITIKKDEIGGPLMRYASGVRSKVSGFLM